jgi:uncharacterized protein YndB with AHSA1/START domain
MNGTLEISGTLETIDDRPALRFERPLAHSPERVWRAISEPDELAHWFVARVDWGPEAGETFDAYGQAGEVTEVDPPRALAWRWGEESFSFEIRPEGEGCVLVFIHVFDDRALGAQHAAGWETYFARLDAHLDGGHLTVEEAHRPVLELHDGYAERFGLDPEPGRRQIARVNPPPATLEDGPKLRFERRFPHSVERVWRAITEPDELAEWFPREGPIERTHEEAPNLLVGTWFGGTLRFELSADNDGTLLVFTHEFDERETAARDAAGWESCFARLSGLLAGEPLGEAESLETWPFQHERYAERFRLDPEVGRRALAEHSTKR